MKLIVRPLAILLVLTAAGCASLGHAAVHRRQAPLQPLSASITGRVILPSKTITAGSSMSVRVVVINRTGHTVRVIACGMPFQVALASRAYRPALAFSSCYHAFTIPRGRSSYRVTVEATYLACSLSRPRGGEKACLPGRRLPPLAPGRYQARLFQAANVVPAPSGTGVRVTPSSTSRS
jgi:hypothetical protein